MPDLQVSEISYNSKRNRWSIHLEPGTESVLHAGQVAPEVCDALRAWFARAERSE